MEPFHQLFLGLVAVLLDIAAITLALVRGHRVEGTLAWLLAIITFPVLGALAYFALSSPSIGRVTRRKKAARFALSGRMPRDPEDRDPDEDLLVLCGKATGLPASAGNCVTLLTGAEEAFQRLEEAIRAAQHSIWAEYYIIRRDETGARFLELLRERALAGVEVKLIYDAFGSMRIDAAGLRAIDAAGGRTAAFLPLNPLRRRWAFHLRNHRKLVVVDGKIAFTGGMNVGNEYSGRVRRKGVRPFRDTLMELQGPAVLDLAHVFAEDWVFAAESSIQDPPLPGPLCQPGVQVAVIPSGPDQPRNATSDVYFSTVSRARERVWLQTPYFVPDTPVLQALTTAAMRGVDVRIIIPAKPDVLAVRSSTRFYYPELLASGVRVFEYRSSMIHAKTLLVDRRVSLVGSANVDFRSLRLNFEVSSVMVDEAFCSDLAGRFLADQGQCVEVSRRDVESWSLALRLWHGTARLLSPLL